MTYRYHIERYPEHLEFWRDNGPCIATMCWNANDTARRAEAEKLAALLLAAANGEEGKA